MPKTDSNPAADARPRTGHRYWFPVTVGLLTWAGIVTIRLQPEMERNFQGWLTAALILLASLLGLIWFFGFSRFSGKLRLGTFGLLLLAAFGGTRLLRVDGTVDGTGLPKLVWRWTSPRTVRSESATTSPSATPAAPNTQTVATTAPASQHPDVPQFFGARRDGTALQVNLARDWSATPPRQLWRQPVGLGWSAFAVVGERAYTQEQRGDSECVTCYALRTGQQIWAQTNAVRFSEWQGGDGPRATPTVHEGRVYTLGATGLLNCLDAESGALKWSRSVLSENQLANLIWGVSASPLVFDDTVVVTGGFTKGPTVLAYRRSTGEPLWQAGTDKASYASPVLVTLAGQRVVLSANAASLTAHDPTTGALRLDYPWGDDKWPKASQPVVLPGDRIFLSAGYGAGCSLLEVKPGTNGELAATQVWKNLHLKTQFNSVAARDGFLYGLDDGLLACVEIATGARKWKDGRYGSGQTLLVDDLILIQSEPGAVILAAAQPGGFQELGRLPALSSKTWNHPTLAGKYLLVRNNEEMAAYELP